MSLSRDKIEYGKIRSLFAKRKAGRHKWMKHCINKLVRIQSKDIDLDDENNAIPKKPYKGWEY